MLDAYIIEEIKRRERERQERERPQLELPIIEDELEQEVPKSDEEESVIIIQLRTLRAAKDRPQRNGAPCKSSAKQ